MPAVIGDLITEVQHASTENSPGRENLPRKEWNRSDETLCQSEADEHHKPKDQHSDDISLFPTVFGGSGDGKREEKQDQSASEKEDSQHWVC